MSERDEEEPLTPQEEKRRQDERYWQILRQGTHEDMDRFSPFHTGLGLTRFTPPYRVDIRSRFHARQDRRGGGGTTPLLDIAIQGARAATKDSCDHAKDFLDWKCFGEYAVIYDATEWLILDTSNEVKEVEGKAVHAVEGPFGR